MKILHICLIAGVCSCLVGCTAAQKAYWKESWSNGWRIGLANGLNNIPGQIQSYQTNVKIQQMQNRVSRLESSQSQYSQKGW